MVQEHDEQIQATTELSEEQLDQVAGGEKVPWPDPKRNAHPLSVLPMDGK